MKHGGKMLVCMVSSLAVCSANAVTTETQDNPYQSIIDRNVFSLKPPPPPVDPAEANKPTALKITLTGITTILGNKRVLMKTAPPPAKAGEAPKTEKSYILTEGEREGDIEVIEIDEKVGSVKVNNAGTVQTLTFEKDGAKLPSTPPPAAPGVAPVPGAAPIPGLPATRAPGQPATPGTTPSFQLPTRIPRLPAPGGQAASNPGLTLPGASPSYANPGVVLPGNTSLALQGSGAAPAQTAAPPPGTTPVPQYSLEEQAILIEANRQAGGPGSAFLPPTILTPHPGSSTPAAQNPTVPSLPIPGRPGQY